MSNSQILDKDTEIMNMLNISEINNTLEFLSTLQPEGWYANETFEPDLANHKNQFNNNMNDFNNNTKVLKVLNCLTNISLNDKDPESFKKMLKRISEYKGKGSAHDYYYNSLPSFDIKSNPTKYIVCQNYINVKVLEKISEYIYMYGYSLVEAVKTIAIDLTIENERLMQEMKKDLTVLKCFADYDPNPEISFKKL